MRTGIAWALVLGLVSACGSALAPRAKQSRAGGPEDVVAGGIVVDFLDGTRQEQVDAWEQDWGVGLRFNSIEGAQDGIAIADGVEDVDGVLARIRSHPAVEAAEPLMTYRALGFTPNDPDFPKQWNLRMIGMPEAWEVSRGKGVVVAVIDTGIAYEDREDFRRVPDLAGVRIVPGYDFVHDNDHPNDDHGHGTHVAGTIAQATDNGVGVAGVAFEASLMPLKVLNRGGSGNVADIADAVRWAVDHGARVLNLSLGGPGRSQILERAIADARRKGAVIVAAAGNSAMGAVDFPAGFSGVVAVGAVGPDGQLAPYSSWGDQLDLVAPGGDKRRGDEGGILQATLDRADGRTPAYAAYQGTSMAAPHVAGVAALLFAAGARDADAVERALFEGARSDAGWTPRRGHGLLDAPGALAALGIADVNWQPLLWSALLLGLLLLSLKPRTRPGYLNVLLNPAVLLPLFVSTVGLFFVRWAWDRWFGGAPAAAQVLSLPVPEWGRGFFGRGRLASPLVYSALIPGILALVAVPWRSIRPVVAGLALGFAGMLLYAAWSGAPALAWLPFVWIARPWLVANAVVCALVTRALLRREGTP